MARSLAFPFFLVLALALAAPVATTSSPAPAPVGAMRHLEGPAYEPTLGITPAGNLFYAAAIPFALPEYPTLTRVLASYDDGATWTTLTHGPEPQVGVFDPYMTVDPDTGRIFRVMVENAGPGGNCMAMIVSDDEGASWQERPDVCASPPFHDHESLVASRPRGPLAPLGYPNLVHVCVNHVEATSCAVSLDGAQTFLPTQPVFTAANTRGFCGGLNSPVRADAEGRVFVTRAWCDEPFLARSDDGGLTWSTHAIGGPALPRDPFGGPLSALPIPYIDLHVVSLAIDAANTLHVLYTAADGMPYYLRSDDHGDTWSPAVRVAAPGITGSDRDRIAIAAGAPGHVAFAYLATDHPDGWATSDWTGARWDMHLGVLTPASPEVAWTHVNPDIDPLGVDDCGVDRCTQCPDGACAGMYDYIDMQIAPDGRPWIAMVDVCHAQCAGTGEHDTAIAAVGTLAAGPSLTRPGEALDPLSWT